MSGQRSELERMVAFSVDIRSDGRPSLFQMAICASSVSRVRGSRPSVMGIGGCNNARLTDQLAGVKSSTCTAVNIALHYIAWQSTKSQ